MTTKEFKRVNRVELSIESPAEIESAQVGRMLTALLQNGYKTNEIGLRLEFLTTQAKPVFDRFQILKNQIAFSIRNQ